MGVQLLGAALCTGAVAAGLTAAGFKGNGSLFAMDAALALALAALLGQVCFRWKWERRGREGEEMGGGRCWCWR